MPSDLRTVYELGFPVLPAYRGTGSKEDKQPRIAWKPYITRRPTDAEITAWETSYPDCNVLIVTGAVAGIVVLDVDSIEGEIAIAAHGGLPDTVCVRTGKGRHYYFKHPGFRVPNRERFIDGCDLRGDGGYVVAPPSLHPGGHRYAWVNDPAEQPIAECPAWLLELIRTPASPQKTPTATTTDSPAPAPARPPQDVADLPERALFNSQAVDGEIQKLKAARIGERNAKLNKAAFNLGQLVAGNGLAEADVIAALTHAARSLDDPEHPFHADEIQRTITSGLDAGQKKPRSMKPRTKARRPEPTPPPVPDAPHPADALTALHPAARNGHAGVPPPRLPSDAPPVPSPELTPDDIGNGERFIADWGQRVLYNVTNSLWYVWQGPYWKADETRHVVELAKITARRIWQETSALDSKDPKRKNAGRLQYMRGIDAMLQAARSTQAVVVTIDELDRNPYLVNCLNGTLDLATDAFHPHDPGNRISRHLAAYYDPAARAPHWDAFLAHAHDGHADLVAFLSRAVGYSLTGLTREEALFFNYGSGANGKGVMIRALRALMNDYSFTIPFSSLLVTKNQTEHRNDLARLVGMRFVIAGEPGKGKRFDEGLLKILTGEDEVTCREIYGRPFSYTPQYKLWFHANEFPLIDGSDYAVRRRINVIPWLVTVSESERRTARGFEAAIHAELSGILTWAIHGYRDYRDRGLAMPELVTEASRKYFAETDPVGSFVADCVERVTDAVTSNQKLYTTYEAWAKDCGMFVVSPRTFIASLEKLGFRPGKRNYGKIWHDLALTETGFQFAHPTLATEAQQEAF